MLPLFAITIFISAALLFQVQPMAGKMVLPLAGGSPAVWNTCMVFFQAALLLGYLYSHLLAKLKIKAQAIVHALVAVAAFVMLPMVLPEGWSPPSESTRLSLWMIGLLGMTLGLPFFVVSTTGPLVQSWFSKTGHERSKDPYFLYAASNIGSAVGLLGYPLVIEPEWRLGEQAIGWSQAYGLLVLLLIACGVVTAKRAAGAAEEVKVAREATAPIAWRRRLMWIALAAVPSSLMSGVTQHISTDLAAVPLLWVIPLFLYLLTFTLAFSPRIRISANVLGWIVGVLALGDCFIVMTGRNKPFELVLMAHVVSFFLAALMCHRRLADDRPPPSRLTEFFLLIAVGGVLGGIFNALVAPKLFVLIVEYPIAIAAACALRPMGSVSLASRMVSPLQIARAWVARYTGGYLGYFWMAVLAALGVWLIFGGQYAAMKLSGDAIVSQSTRSLAGLGFAALVLLLVPRPIIFATTLLAVTIVGQNLTRRAYGDYTLTIRRSFFGVSHVYAQQARSSEETDREPPTVVTLMHGTTVHGLQLHGALVAKRADGSIFLSDSSLEPRTYYHRHGPVGEIFRSFEQHPFYASIANESGVEIAFSAQSGQVAGAMGLGLPLSSPLALASGPGLTELATARKYTQGPLGRIAVVGMGTGSILAYCQAGQQADVYEIDEEIVSIAGDPEYFTYVTSARERGAKVNIIVGDGRLKLVGAPDADTKGEGYGLIFVDAFSSDSIPVHLITKEAVELYLKKLRPDGAVALHISNRHFQLGPVVARIADEVGAYCWIRDDFVTTDPKSPRGVTPDLDEKEFMSESTWMLLSRSPVNVPSIEGDKEFWVRVGITGAKVPNGTPLWTDDFSNILGVYQWSRPKVAR